MARGASPVGDNCDEHRKRPSSFLNRPDIFEKRRKITRKPFSDTPSCDSTHSSTPQSSVPLRDPAERIAPEAAIFLQLVFSVGDSAERSMLRRPPPSGSHPVSPLKFRIRATSGAPSTSTLLYSNIVSAPRWPGRPNPTVCLVQRRTAHARIKLSILHPPPPPSTATLHPPFAKLKLFDADDDWKLLSQYLPASSSGVVWL